MNQAFRDAGTHYPCKAPRILIAALTAGLAMLTATVCAAPSGADRLTTGSISSAPQSGPAIALWGESYPLSTATGNQSGPSIAYAAGPDQYLAIWLDKRAGATTYQVYGQFLAADGTVTGTNFLVAEANGEAAWPTLVWNGAQNEYLVAWRQWITTSDWDIYVQRVSASGSLAAGPILASSGSGRQEVGSLTWNAVSNEYLLSILDYPSLSVYGCRLSAFGWAAAPCFQVSTGGTALDAGAVAANGADNEYLFVWSDRRWEPAGSDVYAQRVSGAGGLLGGNFPVVIDNYWQSGAAIAWNATQPQYVISWYDSVSGNIRGQQITRSGIVTGTDFPISAAGAVQGGYRLCWNSADNDYLAIWTDARGGSTEHLYGQIFDVNGGLIGGNFLIGPSDFRQSSGSVARNSKTNRYVAVWGDWRSGTNWDIYAQRLWRPSSQAFMPLVGKDWSASTAPPH